MWHPPPVFDVGGKARLAELPFPDQGVESGALQKLEIFQKDKFLSGGGFFFGASKNPKRLCSGAITYNVHL